MNFYLANDRTGDRGSSAFIREAAFVMRDCGWGLWPIWVPFKDTECVEFLLDRLGNQILDPVTRRPQPDPRSRLAEFTRLNGEDHGRRAARLAAEFGIEKGATIYLDLEVPILSGARTARGPAAFVEDYTRGWSESVRAARYRTGLYCSFLDANAAVALLDVGGGPTIDALWPFQLNPGAAALPRADWDPARGLTPLPVSDWEDANRRRVAFAGWATNARTIGVQQAQPGSVAVRWQAGARTESFTGIDWNSAKPADPSHPAATSAVAASTDRSKRDIARGYRITSTVLTGAERAAPAGGATPVAPARSNLSLALGAADQADPWGGVAAVSRAADHHDVFWVHPDGWVKTSWEDATQRNTAIGHINRDDPGNPGRWVLARKGSPLAAVSMNVDRLDVFYVDTGHRLFHQWWAPTSSTWSTNGDWVGGADLLVAPASNIAALPLPTAPAATATTGRWDVLFISQAGLDGPHRTARTPHAAGPLGNAQRQIPKATVLDWLLGAAHQQMRYRLRWATGGAGAPTVAEVDTQTPAWSILSVATGVAACRGVDDRLHVVFQERARAALPSDDAASHELLHIELAAVPAGAPIVPLARRSVAVFASRTVPTVGRPPSRQPSWLTTVRLLARPNLTQAARTELLLVAIDSESALHWWRFDGATWTDHGSAAAAGANTFGTSRELHMIVSANSQIIDLLGVTETGALIHARLGWTATVVLSSAPAVLP